MVTYLHAVVSPVGTKQLLPTRREVKWRVEFPIIDPKPTECTNARQAAEGRSNNVRDKEVMPRCAARSGGERQRGAVSGIVGQ